MKKVIFLIRAAPYGMATAGEGFRALIGTGGLGVEVRAILVEDGVFIAKKNQQPEKIAMANLKDAYRRLSEFGVRLFVHRESARERNLREDDTIPAQWISTAELKDFINSSDLVISFV